jgi:hypothetical protein
LQTFKINGIKFLFWQEDIFFAVGDSALRDFQNVMATHGDSMDSFTCSNILE